MVVMVAAAALALAGVAKAGPVNLVDNGSFETGDFTGWTQGGNTGSTAVLSGAYYVYSGAEDGTYFAVLGPVGSDGTLDQSLATTVGDTYTLSFYLASVGDSPSDFSASLGGTTLYSVIDPNSGGAYTQYVFGYTATSSSTDLNFTFRDDPAFMALDNIAVTLGAPSVPESKTLAAGLLALPALGLWTLKRRGQSMIVVRV
jgi:hypothetical protein